MSLQTPEKEIPVKGYSATQPAVLDAAHITEADLAAAAAAFHRDGYFIARGNFSPEEIEELNSTFMKMHADGGLLLAPQDTGIS